MKEREDYRSKKALAIGAGIATAIIVAVGGTAAFIKSRPDSTAVNNVVENQITNTATIDDTTNSTQNVSINEVTNTSTDSTSNKGNTTTNNTTNSTTNTTTVVNIVNSNPSTNNGTAKDLNKNTTANKVTNTTNNTTTDNTKMEEFVQTTVVEGKKNVKVYDERDVEWSPLALAAISGVIEVSKPNIESTKYAYVNGIVVENMEESYVAHVGDEITYVIKIANNGSKAKTINSYDSIPEGTKLVEGSITNDGVENSGKISWKTTIKAGKTVELSFKVVVEKEITVVKNTATVNGEPTNEVETPVVTSEKVVHVLDSEGNIMDGVTVASAGQRLLYIIRVKNTSKVAGVANVSDTIDTEAITVDEESITEGGNYTDGTITWDNVEVPANGRAKLQFEATVNSDGEFNVISNKANVNGHDTPDAKIPYITIEKKPSVAFAKNNDIYTYSIELTNNSEITGKTTVFDKIPEGTAFVEGSIVGNGKYDDTTKTITWDEVEVKPGTTTVSFNVRVRSATVDAIKNTAKVGDVDVPSDDVPVAKMKVEKTIVDEDSNKEYKVGEKVKYVITVTNLGSKDLSNVVVKDDLTVHDDNNSKVATVTSIKVGNTTLSNVDSYVSTENNGGDAILVITIPTLTVEDKEAEIKLEYEVTAGDVGVGNHKIINSATVQSDEIPDPIPDPKDPEVVTDNYTNVQVSKEWKDNNDQDGKRPASVRVTLKANGKDADSSMNVSIPSVELNDSNEWKYEWIKVLADIDGKAITYTVEEDDVTFEESGETRKYDSKVEVVSTTDRVTTLKVTNTHDPIPYNETPEDPDVKPGTITIKKVWDDKDNQDGKRPESVTVHLIGTIKDDNGADVEISSAEYQVKASEGWSKTIKDLPKYNSGKEITYTVTENKVDEYTTKDIPAVSDGKVSVTNTHEPELYNGDGEIEVTKSWDDKDNQDGMRPDSVTIHLIGTIKNDDGSTKQVSSAEYTISKDAWKVTIEKLPKYNSGKEITYTVTEDAISKYKTETIPAIKDGKVTVTNTHTPEKFNDNGEITVKKVWNDANNQDNKRSAIGFTLYENDDVKETITLTASNVDPKNPNVWTYTWTNLDKYKAGEEIKYTVVETTTDSDYTSTISAEVPATGEAAGIATITNTRTADTTSYVVTKVWNDNSDQDGYRKDVEISLYGKIEGQDKELIKTVKTSDASTDDVTIVKNGNNWTVTFNNLPVNKVNQVGKKVTYSVEEKTDLAEYTEGKPVVSSETQATITNTHETDKTTYTVVKAWDDEDDRDGLHNSSKAFVQLKADGVNHGEKVELNTSNEFTYTWEGLEKKNDGKDIVYSVEEVDVPTGYTIKSTTVDGLIATITNKHIPEKYNEDGKLTVKKVWDDQNNVAGFRPSKITINLVGKVDGNTVYTATSKDITTNNGTVTFDNLYKYYQGKEIQYEVSETYPDGYENKKYTTAIAYGVKTDETGAEVTDKGNVIVTNSYTPETVNITAVKTWKDIDENTTVVVTLNKSVGTAETATLDHTTTSKTWSNLPKYSNATEIEYTISEAKLKGYVEDTQVSEDGKTYTFTNSKGYIEVEKTFKEIQDASGNKVETRTTTEVGDVLVYEITVKNTGYVTLTNVKVTDNRKVTVKESGVTATYADGVTTISGKANNTLAPKGEAGDTITYTVYYTVTEEDLANADVPLKNKAKATGEYTDSTDDKVTPEDESEEETVVKTEHPHLSVTKVSDAHNLNRNLRVGDTVTYTVTVKNTGNTILDKVSVVDELTTKGGVNGALVINTSDSYDVTSNDDGTKTVTFKNPLAIGASVSYTATYTVTADDTSTDKLEELTNKVTVDTDKTDPEDTTVTDKVDNTQISITITKTWNDSALQGKLPEGTVIEHPEVIFDIFADSATTATQTKTLGKQALTLQFTGLNKYANDGHTIDYKVQERPVRHYESGADIPVTVDKVNDTDYRVSIENTFVQDISGEVEITTTTPATTAKVPMDVVLVLDLSSSMVDHSKLENCRVGKLIDAVNSIMNKIYTDNPGSRVGIMTYNNKESQLLALGEYTPISGKYLVGSKSGNGTGTFAPVTIKATVNGNNNYSSVTTAQGTYTQLGIVKGANMLISEATTTATVSDKTVTRTPVVILLTDGEPWTGNDKLDCTGNTVSDTDTIYANTIKSAYTYKNSITTHYYGANSEKAAKFYTIGYEVSGDRPNALLDPTKANIDKVTGIRDKLGGAPAAYGYDYSDQSFSTTMSDNNLAQIFDQIINAAQEHTDVDNVDPGDLYRERIDLPNIDISKAFTIKINQKLDGSGPEVYSAATASTEAFNQLVEESPYLKHDSVGYYIDMLLVDENHHVKVTYNTN